MPHLVPCSLRPTTATFKDANVACRESLQDAFCALAAMIFEAFELVRSELQDYIRAATSTPGFTVEMGSIAAVAGANTNVLLTLVNLEEEQTLKNTSPYQRNASGGYDLKNPPVFLNLYVLITANYDNANYSTALKHLAHVIQCLQGKNHYTVANTPDSAPSNDPRASTLHVTLDLCSLSFEKINQLWGTLGGKQVPFVLYKMRVVEELADKQVGGGGAVLTIEGKVENVNPRSEN